MRNLLTSIVLVFLSINDLSAQNADLNFITSAGKYHGLGGAGIAIATSTDAFDLNPAGLSASSSVVFSLTQNLNYYDYSLYRRNAGVGAIIFNWDRWRYSLQNGVVTMPFGKRFTLAAGFLEKLDPFVRNNRHAITWSSMFRQTTNGHVNALSAAAGVRFLEKFSFGMMVYRYFGTITSEIQGENHGNDAGKWARLENNFSGWSFKLGSQLKLGMINIGATVEFPYKLNVKATSHVSSDQLYKNYLPGYKQTHWQRPITTGFGFAYTGIRNFTFLLDYEYHGQDNSDVQLNLFEFGGHPNWKKSQVVRTGCEIKLWQYPIRVGYASFPQQYASNISEGQGNTIISYKNTSQNKQSLFTAGTSLAMKKYEVNIALNYGIINWHRDLNTTWQIRDEFTEHRLTLILEIKMIS
jgi:hypothetical protein